MENKHLHRQKLALSKDLNRLNTQGDSLVQLREENVTLKARVEVGNKLFYLLNLDQELEAEKEAFKSMMETLVESQPNETKSTTKGKLGKFISSRLQK